MKFILVCVLTHCCDLSHPILHDFPAIIVGYLQHAACSASGLGYPIDRMIYKDDIKLTRLRVPGVAAVAACCPSLDAHVAVPTDPENNFVAPPEGVM
jgi:hypothetical protein